MLFDVSAILGFSNSIKLGEIPVYHRQLWKRITLSEYLSKLFPLVELLEKINVLPDTPNALIIQIGQEVSLWMGKKNFYLYPCAIIEFDGSQLFVEIIDRKMVPGADSVEGFSQLVQLAQ